MNQTNPVSGMKSSQHFCEYIKINRSEFGESDSFGHKPLGSMQYVSFMLPYMHVGIPPCDTVCSYTPMYMKRVSESTAQLVDTYI